MGTAKSSRRQQDSQQQQDGVQQAIEDYGSNAEHAMNLQMLGVESGEDPSAAFEELAKAEMEQAMDAIWEAIKHPEIDVKEAAIEVFIQAVEHAQLTGAEEVIENHPDKERVGTLIQQISQMGGRKKMVEMAALCQFLGLDPPAAASAVVKEEADNMSPTE